MLLCDNQSVIHFSKNSMYHSKSKHIELRHHWTLDVLEKKELVLEKIHTANNGFDMLTKVVSPLKLEACRNATGLVGRSVS